MNAEVKGGIERCGFSMGRVGGGGGAQMGGSGEKPILELAPTMRAKDGQPERRIFKSFAQSEPRTTRERFATPGAADGSQQQQQQQQQQRQRQHLLKVRRYPLFFFVSVVALMRESSPLCRPAGVGTNKRKKMSEESKKKYREKVTDGGGSGGGGGGGDGVCHSVPPNAAVVLGNYAR